ncbi:MAG: helix-turn-helix transcriptional regulator [Actinobacteria bacterium]|nr:MAG: helix-turn-helix transcriptional regulator [Actinomycetota bacterium]
MLDVADAVFAERGYHGASMDDIARRVGVTKPMLYNYFGSKQGLYLAGVQRADRPHGGRPAAGAGEQRRAGGLRGRRSRRAGLRRGRGRRVVGQLVAAPAPARQPGADGRPADDRGLVGARSAGARAGVAHLTLAAGPPAERGLSGSGCARRE